MNALPLPLRRYIHELEANCDQTGLVQAYWALKDQVRDLVAAYVQLRVERPPREA